MCGWTKYIYLFLQLINHLIKTMLFLSEYISKYESRNLSFGRFSVCVKLTDFMGSFVLVAEQP